MIMSSARTPTSACYIQHVYPRHTAILFVPVDKAKSPGVDPKQLAAELQKVSLQQSPLVMSSVVEKGSHAHSGPTSAGSSSVPSPGQPGSPSVSKKKHSSTKVRRTPRHYVGQFWWFNLDRSRWEANEIMASSCDGSHPNDLLKQTFLSSDHLNNSNRQSRLSKYFRFSNANFGTMCCFLFLTCWQGIIVAQL